MGRKPARRRQRLEKRWRALRILRKQGTRSTCRWKALRSVKAASFDEGVVEAVLAFWFDLTRAG